MDFIHWTSHCFGQEEALAGDGPAGGQWVGPFPGGGLRLPVSVAVATAPLSRI